jgi:2,4-dienoyl-CoA reductase-like NADH-dependent reductase (Old Yellow Enzyme family)
MSLLFEPTSLGKMTLRNRIVKSATMENMATPDGLPTDDTRAFYEDLARGGAGLIITGYAYVNEVGQSAPLQSGAHTDHMIPEWRRITDVVHQMGAKIGLQIVHGGRQTQAKALGDRRPVAPSRIPNFVYFVQP